MILELLLMSMYSPRGVEVAVKYGPKPYPKSFPKDIKSHHFPVSILKHKLQNDDFSVKDWSEARLAWFCFHCRPFKLATSGGSSLSLIYVLYCCLKCNTINKNTTLSLNSHNHLSLHTEFL